MWCCCVVVLLLCCCVVVLLCCCVVVLLCCCAVVLLLLCCCVVVLLCLCLLYCALLNLVRLLSCVVCVLHVYARVCRVCRVLCIVHRVCRVCRVLCIVIVPEVVPCAVNFRLHVVLRCLCYVWGGVVYFSNRVFAVACARVGAASCQSATGNRQRLVTPLLTCSMQQRLIDLQHATPHHTHSPHQSRKTHRFGVLVACYVAR